MKISLIVICCFCLFVISVVARPPCEYCEYCEFCSLCENKCPCDDQPNCEYCKYCSYCTLCSLCDSACAEDSYVRSALEWFDSWKSIALDKLGVDELPELDQVDKELEGIDAEISKYKSKRAVLKSNIRALANDLADLSYEEFGAVMHLVQSMHPDWWTKKTVKVNDDLVDHKHDEL